MKRGAERFLLGTFCAVVALGLTVTYYEAAVVPQLNSSLASAQSELAAVQDDLDFKNRLVEAAVQSQVSCEEAASSLQETLSAVVDASQMKTDAVGDFFDRYSYLAGDSRSLGSSIYDADTAMNAAVDSYLASVTYTECVQ